MKFGDIHLMRDHGHPIIICAQGAPGESGVSVARLNFHRAAQFVATPRHHLICIQVSPHLQLDCRMAERKPQHDTFGGAIAICPAGIDASVTTDMGADVIVLTVNPNQLSVAAAEDSALEAKLIEL